MQVEQKVKERPILFQTPMVQAILEGRKTVTRRVIKESFNGCLTNGGPHPCPNDPVVIYPGEIYESPCHPGESITVDWPQVRAIFHCSTLDSESKCPYGKPGDVLWVRETFTILDYWEDSKAVQVMYEGGATKVCALTDREWSKFVKWQERTERKSSLFMFRSLSRLTLEITSISVERLQDITEEDAIREGIEPTIRLEKNFVKGEQLYKHYTNPEVKGVDPIGSFRSIFQSINGPEFWNRNDWVWRIAFSKL
jgi:hypothetical protein